MKLSPALLFRTAALALVLGAFSYGNLAQGADNDAFVTAVGGNVQYSSGGGAFVALPVGARLKRGDVVKTGPSSHADLEIGNNVGIIQVTPESTLAISDLTVSKTQADTVTTSEFDLSTGAIYARINKLSKASRYEIKTPKGIAGVRGTTIYLTANGDLTVGEGTAGIAYYGAGAHVVRGGQTISPGDNAPHPAPGQLLKEIIESLRDAATHGIGRDLRPFVPPTETYVSPILPSGGTGSGTPIPPETEKR